MNKGRARHPSAAACDPASRSVQILHRSSTKHGKGPVKSGMTRPEPNAAEPLSTPAEGMDNYPSRSFIAWLFFAGSVPSQRSLCSRGSRFS